jgi:diacylglycerol kinase
MGRVCSIFSQILRFIPRTVFESAVRKHETEKHAKGMTSWSQFIALLFCHLGGARSLREIVDGLAASEGKLKHLGLDRAPTRSTPAYANGHRSWQLYKTVFEGLAALCQSEAKEKKRKFRFKHPLLTLDATVIPVCVSMFEWARYVKTKGAVKLHLVLDNGSFLPQYAVITKGNTADVTAAKTMEFSPGTILVFDRGYEDHKWWRKLTAGGVFFVSRLKDNTSYLIAETRAVPAGTHILRDEVVMLASDRESAEPMRLRRIEVWLEEKQDTMVFVTNQLKLAASTIAAIYKDRWQIELFFKAIKQSLRIKTFIGTSENAVQTQIWTALIAMLLVRYLQLRSTWNWGLSNLVALLRQQLFVYRDLWAWLNQPFQVPPALDDLQLALPLTS